MLFFLKVLLKISGTSFLIVLFLMPIVEWFSKLYCKLILNDPFPLSTGCLVQYSDKWFTFILLTIIITVSLFWLFIIFTNKSISHKESTNLVVPRRKNHYSHQVKIDTQPQVDNLLRSKLELKKKIFALLKNFHFKVADELYIKNKTFLEDCIDEESLDQYRAELIQQYFGSRMEYPPDLEQAEAVGALGQNVLVSARAGSGKTATISAKVAYLCDKYGVDPSEIMVLCFNNSAAINMKKEIQNLVPRFENARTFHSWASSIVMPERGSVLSDDKDGKKEYSNFIKKLITR